MAAPVTLMTMRIAILAVLLCAGCQITPYDPATDAMLTDIQRRVDGHVAALGLPGAQPSRQFYAGVTNDLHLLETRTEARQSGDLSVGRELAAIKELTPMVVDMSKLDNGSESGMGVARDEFDTAIRSVMALELRRPR